MKIVHIVENLDDRYGGPARSVPLLCAALRKIDVKTTLLSVQKYKNEANETIAAKNLEWRSLASSIKLFLYIFGLRSEKVILHINNLWSPSTLASFIAAKLLDIPYVVSVRGMLYPWAMKRSRYKKKLFWYLFQKKMLQSAACIHATEDGEANAVRALGIISPIAVVPNGIELDEFDTVLTKNEAKERLGLDCAKRYTLFLSRLHPKKGIEMLLKSWQKVESLSNWELLIVGEGDKSYEDGLKKSFADMQNTRFLGRLQGDDRIAAFRAADFFVLPSYSENFGMAIAEAMASGLAVITTKETPWGEIVRLGGKWIDASEKALNVALSEYLTFGEEELSNIGARLREQVKYYDVHNCAAMMKATYEWLLDRIEKPNFVQLN